jgi:hypothetical protein
MGWCDKPKEGILSEKPSSQYRVGRQGFEDAERVLLGTKRSQRSIVGMLPLRKKQRKENEEKVKYR